MYYHIFLFMNTTSFPCRESGVAPTFVTLLYAEYLAEDYFVLVSPTADPSVNSLDTTVNLPRQVPEGRRVAPARSAVSP